MSQAEKLYELVASCSDSALMLVSFNFMLGPNLRKITTKVSYRGCVLAANRSPFPSRSERSIAGVNMSRDTYSAYLCIKTMSYPLHAQHAIFSVEQRLATEGKFFSKDWQLLQACHVQTDRSSCLVLPCHICGKCRLRAWVSHLQKGTVRYGAQEFQSFRRDYGTHTT